MAIARDRIIPLDTIQADFRDEFGKFIDAFNALIETYVALRFATQQEVNEGTATGVVVNPATLAEHLRSQRFTTEVVSAGPEDGQRAPRLRATGVLDASFLPLATVEEMQAGQSNAVIVTALRAATETSRRITEALTARISAGPQSAGAADAGRAPVLDDNGQLDPSYLNPVPSLYIGAMNPTVAGGGLSPPILNGSNAHMAGNYAVVKESGTYDFDLGGPSPTGESLVPLDVVYFNGATWDIIPNPMDIADFLRRDGSVPMNGNLNFALAGGTTPQHQITGAIIDCGTF